MVQKDLLLSSSGHDTDQVVLLLADFLHCGGANLHVIWEHQLNLAEITDPLVAHRVQVVKQLL